MVIRTTSIVAKRPTTAVVKLQQNEGTFDGVEKKTLGTTCGISSELKQRYWQIQGRKDNTCMIEETREVTLVSEPNSSSEYRNSLI